MKAKLPLIIVIIVVVVLIVVAIILGTSKKEGEETTGLEKKAIAEEIHGFTAEIKEIKDKTLTLEGWIAMANAEEEPIKALAKAVVTDDTKIVKLKFPNPKDIPEGSEEPVYPEETKISFDELKVGDKINIATIENISENIKNQTEFIINDIFIVE